MTIGVLLAQSISFTKVLANVHKEDKSITNVSKYKKTSVKNDKTSWISKASMKYPRQNFKVVVMNNKIYAIGGHDGSKCLNKVEEYNPKTNQWTVKADMINKRSNFEVAVTNNKIYIFGGFNNSNSIHAVEEYDPKTNKWTSKSDIPKNWCLSKVAVVNNKIYALGEDNITDIESIRTKVKEYDPIMDKWNNRANMDEFRYGYNIVVANNKIYLISGDIVVANNKICLMDSNLYENSKAAIKEYDPASNKWSTKSKVLSRIDSQVVVIDDKIFILGGYPLKNIDMTCLSEVEEYDIEKNIVVKKSDMKSSGIDCKAVALGEKIYIIGGITKESDLSKIQEYTPETDEWIVKDGTSKFHLKNKLALLNNKIYSIGGHELKNDLIQVSNKVAEYNSKASKDAEYKVKISQEKALELAGEFLKLIGRDVKEYAVDYIKEDNDLIRGEIYNISYVGKEDMELRINKYTGTIGWFFSYGSGEERNKENIEYNKAKDIAKEVFKKIYPDKYDKVVLKEYEEFNRIGDDYLFEFIRVENNIPVLDNSIAIKIEKSTGKVQNINER